MRKFLFLIGCSSIVASPALAQTAVAQTALPQPVLAQTGMAQAGIAEFPDDIVYAEPVANVPITVTATGLELEIDETGQPVTIISEEELDLIQGPDLGRVLTRAPGVTVTRNGGVGGFTGVRVRGAGAEQLLVLIDGVRVNDIAAPGGGFDFGNLLAGDVQRVELLRGPNSVVWGSDAIAGVMNIVTRVQNGIRASAEYGAFDTAYATLGGGIELGAIEAGLTGSYYESDGFSASRAGTEKDGFDQWQVTGRLRYALSSEISVTASGRYADGTLEMDGYPAPSYVFGDTEEVQDTREWSGRIGGLYEGDALRLNAGYAVSDTRREYVDPAIGDAPYYGTSGRSERAELFGRYDLPAALALDFGASREWTDFDDSGSDRSAAITGTHALLGWYGERFALAGGARYDDHSIFGDAWTFGANGSVALTEDLRLRASYGEGFKAPTLYQSSSAQYGNAELAPERSKAYDIGVELGGRNDAFFAALSAFRRDSRNLIDYISCPRDSDPICEGKLYGTYDNVGEARAEGFELELGARVTETLRTLAVYSYVETTDRTEGSVYEGNELARRPRHAATVSLDWTSPWGPSVGGDIRLVGDSFDDRGNFTRLDGYATADIRAALPVSATLELFGRVENVFDAAYEPVAGYNTAGRAAYVGARYRL